MRLNAHRLQEITPYAGPILVVAIFELSWAFSIWSGNRNEFSPSDTAILFLHIVSVIALQSVVLALLGFALRKFRYRPHLIVVISSVFCTFAFYSLVLIFIAGFTTSSVLYQSLGLLGVFLIGLLVFTWALTPPGVMFVGVLVGVFAISTLVNLALSATSERTEYRGTKLPQAFVPVKFQELRNVYLIAFDSLMPSAVAKRLLNLHSLPYVETLEHLNMRILHNTFADRVPTNKSLNSILALDLKWWDQLDSERWLLETGERPGPLYTIFKDNGYSIQFFYSNNRFGPAGTARVDFYGTANSGICTKEHQLSLMALCVKEVTDAWQSFLGVEQKAYPQLLFDRIEETAQSADRWLTLAYIWSPGHTRLDFNLRRDSVDDYRKYFARRSLITAKHIATLVRFVEEKDPGAVLVIFGDHGPYISRGLSPEDPSPLTAKEVIQDRHAVLVAIYPRTFCQSETSHAEEPLGLVRLMRLIVKCLAGGTDPISGEAPEDEDFVGYEYE